jgi:hypothetical protein
MPQTVSTEGHQSSSGKQPYPRGHWVHVVTMIGIIIYTGMQGCQTYLISQNNVISERAFVSPAMAGLYLGTLDDAAKTPGLAVVFSLSNNGGTPTKDLTSKIICEPSINVPTEPWELIKQHKIDTTPIFIGARAGVQVQCSFSMDQIKQMSGGSLHGYILGDVTYWDRIDPATKHRTEYAYELFSPTITITNGIITNVTSAAIGVGKHNCADEECPKD